MNKLQKVLILSSTLGQGHQQAALAIQEELLSLNGVMDVRVIDYLQMVYPLLNSFARYCYFKSARYVPSLYRAFYHYTGQLKPASSSQKLFYLGKERLIQYLNTFQPDLVISTFPTPAGILSKLKEQGIIQFPTVTVITDYAFHGQWIQTHTDMYFVGNDFLKQRLMDFGIPDSKIAVTGIPIRNKFYQSVDRVSLQNKYHLTSQLPTVLVMGGAYGILQDIAKICEKLFHYPQLLQVLVVCGRNKKLYNQIQQAAKEALNPVQVFGFVQDMHELMAVSDLIITKAGGLTVSESLAMGLPMLLYKPIPGQEEQNSDFLVESKVAVLAKTRMDVEKYLETLLEMESELLQSLRKNTESISKAYAVKEIVNRIQSIV